LFLGTSLHQGSFEKAIPGCLGRLLRDAHARSQLGVIHWLHIHLYNQRRSRFIDLLGTKLNWLQPTARLTNGPQQVVILLRKRRSLLIGHSHVEGLISLIYAVI
jgi:hypothetical protein